MSTPQAQETGHEPGVVATTLAEQAGALLHGIAHDLAAAEAGHPVHGARRRIKRLRSYARLVRKVAGEDAYAEANRQLRTAADALSGLRRREALDAAIDRLGEKLEDTRGLRQLVADHHAAHVDTVTPEQSLATAREAMAAAQATIGSWRITAADQPAIARSFARGYRKARRRLREALRGRDPASLHDARKQVIHHMHHLELLAGALPQDQAPRIAALTHLRNLLGDFNDLFELRQLAAAQEPGLDKDVRKTIRQRQKKLLAHARAARAPLFGDRTKSYIRDMGAMWLADEP